MPPLNSTDAPAGNRRRRLLARTALCGVLGGVHALNAAPAIALPVGGFAEVGAGGAQPVITSSPGRTDVTLNASRTVINWTSFNVGPDETVGYAFGARNWIVLNKITGFQQSKIEGTIEGKVGGAFGGNIWFISQNSIIVGKGATIDAGGLLFGIGTLNTSDFLNPSNNLFSFDGGDALPNSRLWVLANAKVTGHGGMVAFAAPTVVTRANAVVTSLGNDVLYGSAKSFQIRMAPGTGGDFDLVDFLVPDSSAGSEALVALDLAGETRANSVFVAAVSKNTLGSAVINLEGMVTAQAVKADGGDIILHGGGGIVNRQAGPKISGVAPTDVFLNRASASRDLDIRNQGRIIPRPWVRPPEEAKDPTSLEQDANPPDDPHDNGFGNGNGNGNGGGNGNGNGNGNGFFGLDAVVVESAELVSSLFNPTAISTLTAGRDAKFSATAGIELGRIVANRDIAVSGPEVKANSLIASGNLSVSASMGVIELAGLGVSREGTITGSSDVSIDAISAPQKLTVTSGGSITVGDGESTVAGAVNLTATQNVTLNLASGRLESVTAGSIASLRGGSLDIGTVTAPRLLAQAASVRIGTANSTGDVYAIATAGDAIVGTANAGDDVFVIATNGTASLGSATVGGQAVDGESLTFVGSPDQAGNGRVVRVESNSMDALLGLGTGSVTGATTVTVRGGRDAIVDVTRELPGAVSVTATRDATFKAPTVRLDAVTAGRDLTLGSSAGDFTLTQAISATRNITVTATGALRVSDVTANSGSITLAGASVNAGVVTASENLTLRALTGPVTTVSYRVGQDLFLQGTSFSLGSALAPVTRDLFVQGANLSFTSPISAGRDVRITATGSLNSGQLTAGRDLVLSAGGGLATGALSATNDIGITSGGAVTAGQINAGRNLLLDAVGKATLGSATVNQNARILAGDVDLTGLLVATTASIESRGGALRVGGAAGDAAGAMTFDANDFGQLRISGALRMFAGSTTGAARGDLTLRDLNVNPASTPNVAFLVGSANNASVTGVVAPTVSGGIVRIGDAADLTWRPNSIFVTGGLGTATFANGAYSNVRSFTEVRLAARQDILMGSQRFITLIQNTAVDNIDVAARQPVGVEPTADELSKVFVAAGRLEVSADNKVVQQNTGPGTGVQAVGVFFTGQFNPALIIDPPKVVELYGAFAQGTGFVSGAAAGGAITFTVVDTSGQPIPRPAGAEYRFNSCDVGTAACSPVFSAPLGGPPNLPPTTAPPEMVISDINAGALAARDGLGGGKSSSSSSSSETSEEAGAAAVSSEALTSPPVLLGLAPVDADEIVIDPVVTGTGSEEIWRQRRQKKNDQ